jgi:DNA repair exonuclease SbcCD ATPase subunit
VFLESNFRSQPTEGSDKRKSYDYSVIMIVDQIEIQMRERCSAGQKVGLALQVN